MSNVLGTLNPVALLAERAHAVGEDPRRRRPERPTRRDERRPGRIDFLAFSGHKLYGPSGVGCSGRAELLDAMDPFLGGGHMIERVYRDHATWNVAPAKFEAGTLPIAQAIALGTAVDYVQSIGIEAVHAHEQSLVAYAAERMQAIQGCGSSDRRSPSARSDPELRDRRRASGGPGGFSIFRGLRPARAPLHDAAA